MFIPNHISLTLCVIVLVLRGRLPLGNIGPRHPGDQGRFGHHSITRPLTCWPNRLTAVGEANSLFSYEGG
jgi:hypothetical protein